MLSSEIIFDSYDFAKSAAKRFGGVWEALKTVSETRPSGNGNRPPRGTGSNNLFLPIETEEYRKKKERLYERGVLLSKMSPWLGGMSNEDLKKSPQGVLMQAFEEEDLKVDVDDFCSITVSSGLVDKRFSLNPIKNGILSELNWFQNYRSSTPLVDPSFLVEQQVSCKTSKLSSITLGSFGCFSAVDSKNGSVELKFSVTPGFIDVGPNEFFYPNYSLILGKCNATHFTHFYKVEGDHDFFSKRANLYWVKNKSGSFTIKAALKLSDIHEFGKDYKSSQN